MLTILQHIAFMIVCLVIVRLHNVVFLEAVASYYTSLSIFKTMQTTDGEHHKHHLLHKLMTDSLQIMQDHYDDINTGELLDLRVQRAINNNNNNTVCHQCNIPLTKTTPPIYQHLQPHHKQQSNFMHDSHGEPFLKRTTIRIVDVMTYIDQDNISHSPSSYPFLNSSIGSNVIEQYGYDNNANTSINTDQTQSQSESDSSPFNTTVATHRHCHHVPFQYGSNQSTIEMPLKKFLRKAPTMRVVHSNL